MHKRGHKDVIHSTTDTVKCKEMQLCKAAAAAANTAMQQEALRPIVHTV